MPIKNCTRCGKIFSSSHPTLCPQCIETDENNFKKVRSFVKDNPRVSIDVVIEATGVSEDRIREYLRLGLIDSASLSGPVLECKKCGKPIDSGTYCVLCKRELSQTLMSSLDAQVRNKDKDSDGEKKEIRFWKRYRSRR